MANHKFLTLSHLRKAVAAITQRFVAVENTTEELAERLDDVKKVMIVTVTEDDSGVNTVYTADKTANEIYEYAANGGTVVCNLEKSESSTISIPLLTYASTSIPVSLTFVAFGFSGIGPEYIETVKVYINNVDGNEDIDVSISSEPRPAIRAGNGDSSIIEGQIDDEELVIYTLSISGEAKATTFSYTTTDTLPSASVIKGKISRNEVASQTSKHYLRVLDLDTTNHTITLSDYISSSAINNATLTIFYDHYPNVAATNFSHAEGSGTFSTGASGSHSEGNDTLASGASSHSEGSRNTASGGYSHAEGINCTASGMSSHAEGGNTIANHAYQHVFGTYNIEDPSTANVALKGNYVEIVGNGSSSARSNAHTLDWDGNAWYAGSVSAGTAQSPASVTNANDLTTKAYVDGAISSNSDVFWVHFVDDLEAEAVSGQYPIVADKTFAELTAAYSADKSIMATYYGNIYILANTLDNGYEDFALFRLLSAESDDPEYPSGTFSIHSTQIQWEHGNNSDDIQIYYNNLYSPDMAYSYPGPSNGQILQYNSTSGKWESANLPTGSLSGLSDTTITSAANGQVLTYNSTSSKWVNSAVPKEVMIVTLAPGQSAGTWQADKTFSEILAHLNSGGIAIIDGYSSDSGYRMCCAINWDSSGILFAYNSFYFDSNSDKIWFDTTGYIINSDESVEYISDNNGTLSPGASLNGSYTSFPTFYAPTSAGTSGYVLTSSGSGAPTWQQPTAVPSASSTAPLADGTAAVGSSTAYARADHVHPSDSTKANVSDVLTKTNTTAFTPTADYQPATKKYVDDHSSSGGNNPTLDLVWEDVYSDWQAGYYYDPDNNFAYTQIPSTETAWGVTELYISTSCTPYNSMIPVVPGEEWRYLNMPIHFDSKNKEVPSIIIFNSSKSALTSYTRTFQDEYTTFTIPANGAWMAVLYANSQEYVLQKHVDKSYDEKEILDNIMADYRSYSLATPPTPNTLTKGYICIGTDDLRPWETKNLHTLFTTNDIPYYMAAIPDNIKACVTDDPYKTNLDYMRLCVQAGGEIICHSGPVITAANENDFDTMYTYFVKNKRQLEHYGFKVRGIFKAGGEGAIYDPSDSTIDAWATHYYEFGDYFGENFPYSNERTMLEDWADYSGLTQSIQSIVQNKSYGIFTMHYYNSSLETAISTIKSALSGYTEGTDYEFVTPSQLYDLLMPTTPSSGGGGTGVTYQLSMTNNVITLTGSDSSTSSVTLPVYNGSVSAVTGATGGTS